MTPMQPHAHGRGPARGHRIRNESVEPRVDSGAPTADNAPRPLPPVVLVEREDPGGHRWHQALELLMEAALSDRSRDDGDAD